MGMRKFNMESVQDNPPAGGYPKFNISRGIKSRGPSGAWIWGAVLSLSFLGFAQLNYTNWRKRIHKREERDAKFSTIAYHMVEQDMFNEKKMDEWVVREKEIMKDVEGWEIAKKNYSVRWTEPTPGC